MYCYSTYKQTCHIDRVATVTAVVGDTGKSYEIHALKIILHDPFALVKHIKVSTIEIHMMKSRT